MYIKTYAQIDWISSALPHSLLPFDISAFINCRGISLVTHTTRPTKNTITIVFSWHAQQRRWRNQRATIHFGQPAMGGWSGCTLVRVRIDAIHENDCEHYKQQQCEWPILLPPQQAVASALCSLNESKATIQRTYVRASL